MARSRALTRSVAYLSTFALGGALLGALFGHAALGLAIGLLCWSAIHLWQLQGLERFLLSRQRRVPEGIGSWRPIFDALDRRRKRERVRRQRLFVALKAFRDAARVLPDGVIVLDQEQRILWFNKAAKRLLGLRYPRDMGNPIHHLVRMPRFMQWLAEGKLDEPLIDLPCPVDESLRLSFRLIGFRAGIRLLVARDISTLMRLEQVRRDFVANVSHELRTPLTVINGYLEALEPEELGDYGDLFLEMRKQSRRMASIVEDLLTLSRLEAQSAPLDEAVSMASMLDSLRRDAEAISKGRHRLEFHRSCEADLRGSSKDLHSAFANIVVNAVRYTPDGGSIVVEWSTHPEGAAFSVRDTGPGIPEQHLPRLTERFYRVSTSRSRDSGGTGLGLAIVKHVLVAHGGRLEIESKVGHGSCFRCVLPQARLALEGD